MNPIIFISGPAGVGKTTAIKALLKRYPELRTSVTYTTRPARTNQSEDKIMYNVSQEEFESRKQAGEFLEWAKVHGDYYGTHREETLALLKTNPVIFNIDVQGTEQVIKQLPKKKITIFLLPESTEQLVQHLKTRGTSDEEAKIRLKTAEFELSKKDLFEYQILNKEGRLEETIEKMAKIIETELKTWPNLDKKPKIK